MYLRGGIVHLMKGSPVWEGGHTQIGLWFTTWQTAPIPQLPGQGFKHFWLLQASFWGQSVLTIHSGLQVGGLPIYPLMQEQTAWLFTTRHSLFGPHGDWLHGLTGGCTSKDNWYIIFVNFSYVISLQIDIFELDMYLIEVYTDWMHCQSYFQDSYTWECDWSCCITR